MVHGRHSEYDQTIRLTKVSPTLAAARRRAVQPSGPCFLATADVGKMSGPPVVEEGDGGQRGLGVGEQGTRGAICIVERGWGRRIRRITVDFSFVTFFSLVFHLSYNFWRSASGRLRLDGSGATHP